MSRIRELSPDLAVVMGDIGGSHMGSVEGFTETKKYADMLGCPYCVITGNHDVEYSPFDPDIFDFEKTFRDVFTGKELFSTVENGGVLVICVSCEHRPAEDFRTHNAVFVSDAQFERVVRTLEEHPGMPTVLVTHAPLAGSGIRRWMPLHTGATNMFMDQTFKAGRWRELAARFPQIKISVSAHLHMSHEYDTAVTFRYGLLHVSCGVMTVCARDDIFQTRLIDVTPQGAVVYTYNHTPGTLRRDVVYRFGSTPEGCVAFPPHGEMLLGDDLPRAVWRLPGGEKYYVATENGLMWEYDPALDEFNGAIALTGGVDELSAEADRLYVRNFDGEIFSVGINDSGRLDRIGRCGPPDRKAESVMRGETLPRVPFGKKKTKEGVYAVIGL